MLEKGLFALLVLLILIIFTKVMLTHLPDMRIIILHEFICWFE